MRDFSAKRDNTPWWQYEQDYYLPVFGAVEFLQQNQGWRQQTNLQNLRLYGDFKNMGLSATTYARQGQSDGVGFRSPLTYNVIKANCDTATALIAKNNTKVSFLTDGGDWSQQRRAKMLEKFVSGLFYQTKTHQKMKKGFLHGCIFGTGATKVYREGNKIKVDPTFIGELLVDEAESVYGEPRQLFQIRQVSKAVLINSFPDKKEIIEDAKLVSEESDAYRHMSDMITIVEAWHLPSGEGANDGKRVLCVSTGDLEVEEYNKSHFPFVFHRWGDRVLGFYGQGIAEILIGTQYELNSLLRTIQTSMRLCSVPKVFVEIGSKVNPAQLNNDIGSIVFYTGQPPIYQPVQGVPVELFNQVEILIKRSFELVGLSQLSATAKKPEGLDSGVALREYKDIENDRFAIIQQEHEQNYLTMAAYMLEIAKEIYEEYGEFNVTAQDNKALKKIKWSQVNLDRESYEMKIYPTSALPSTPSGRLQAVSEQYQAGFLTKEEAFSLLDFPDTEAVSNRINADYDSIQMVIEYMLDKGKYIAPEPYMNLQMGIREVQLAYLQAKTNEAPEERMALLRRWIAQAQGLIEQFATPPPQAMPQAAPMANPEPLPVSELVPQVPQQ